MAKRKGRATRQQDRTKRGRESRSTERAEDFDDADEIVLDFGDGASPSPDDLIQLARDEADRDHHKVARSLYERTHASFEALTSESHDRPVLAAPLSLGLSQSSLCKWGGVLYHLGKYSRASVCFRAAADRYYRASEVISGQSGMVACHSVDIASCWVGVVCCLYGWLLCVAEDSKAGPDESAGEESEDASEEDNSSEGNAFERGLSNEPKVPPRELDYRVPRSLRLVCSQVEGALGRLEAAISNCREEVNARLQARLNLGILPGLVQNAAHHIAHCARRVRHSNASLAVHLFRQAERLIVIGLSFAISGSSLLNLPDGFPCGYDYDAEETWAMTCKHLAHSIDRDEAMRALFACYGQCVHRRAIIEGRLVLPEDPPRGNGVEAVRQTELDDDHGKELWFRFRRALTLTSSARRALRAALLLYGVTDEEGEGANGADRPTQEDKPAPCPVAGSVIPVVCSSIGSAPQDGVAHLVLRDLSGRDSFPDKADVIMELAQSLMTTSASHEYGRNNDTSADAFEYDSEDACSLALAEAIERVNQAIQLAPGRTNELNVDDHSDVASSSYSSSVGSACVP